jgi:hypothetical protein
LKNSKSWFTLLEEGAYLQKGDRKIAVTNFHQVWQHILSDSRRAISVTGMRGRQFNSFTGSLDAIGAIPDLSLAVKVMQGLASPTFAKQVLNLKRGNKFKRSI